MAEGSELTFTTGHGRGAGGVTFAKHADGVCLFSCGVNGEVAVRDATTGAVQTKHAASGEGANAALLCIAASPGGGQVATADKGQFVKASFIA